MRRRAAVTRRAMHSQNVGTQSSQSTQRKVGFAALAAFALFVAPAGAQRGNQQPPASARAVAPVDFQGYWVSVVTEDWRWRMMTPAKGDYASVPLNAEGTRVADTWDPAKDEAAGEQCRSYGAPAIMRVPGRLHITWQDDNTLRIDTDAGTQTRLFHFTGSGSTGSDPQFGSDPAHTPDTADPNRANATWQGRSVALWERGGGGRRGAAPILTGSLKVVTTGLRPGYLRKNGVPYSASTILTEYYNATREDNGDSWLIVTTVVQDPRYLNGRFFTSSHFKKVPGASGWKPTACAAR
jgi:hypothetical protein